MIKVILGVMISAIPMVGLGALVFFVGSFFQKDSYKVSLQCATGSMEPGITCFDILTLNPTFSPEDLDVGTIIATIKCGDPIDGTGIGVVHRVVAIRTIEGQSEYLTQGDSNPEPDECWHPLDRVYGYVSHIEKRDLTSTFHGDVMLSLWAHEAEVKRLDAELLARDARLTRNLDRLQYDRYNSGVPAYNALATEYNDHLDSIDFNRGLLQRSKDGMEEYK